MMERGTMNVLTLFEMNGLTSYATEMYSSDLTQAIKIFIYCKIYYTREIFYYIGVGGNIQTKESLR